jgi:transitional endoplasmic reticulum ATPase
LLILVGSVGLVVGIYFLAKGIQKLALKIEKKKAKSKKQSKKAKENNDDEQDEVQEIDPVTGEAKPVKTPKTYKAKIKFDDIAGLEEAKEAFKEKVILPFEHPEIYEKFGKKAGGGILLYGLPGTGKTMFAEATSNELNATFIPVKCSDIKSKWYGESEQKVKAIFAKAKKSKKAIIFFDEFEAIGAKRTDDGNNGNNDLVPEILAEMQGVGSSRSDSTIMIIAATNKPWAIDSAFMRPGRFDEKIYIPLPDMVARKKLFEIQLSKLPVADDLDYDYLAKITEGFNGADIKGVCEKLKMSAIKDSLDKGEDQTIGMDDVAKIEKAIKSSVSQEDIAQLKAFEEGLK